jgi:hypothetical protein
MKNRGIHTSLVFGPYPPLTTDSTTRNMTEGHYLLAAMALFFIPLYFACMDRRDRK